MMQTTTNPSTWKEDLRKLSTFGPNLKPEAIPYLEYFIQSLLSRKEEEVRKEVVEFIRMNYADVKYTEETKYESLGSVLEAAIHPKR